MRFTFLLTLLLSCSLLQANETENSKGGSISGQVIDENTKKQVEYATIAVYDSETGELINGGITDSEGFFKIKELNTGNYSLEITFMGYETLKIQNLQISQDHKQLKLGEVKLKINSKEIEAVDVVADQASISYKIDKKVVNVSQQLTAVSGSAVEILENVPSVKVDIEGNVSLRGSEAITVLIDGRPTVLDASDALAQIPAGSIENIEIITNPSAKYEPDGTAGIINIITKKNKLNGMSGVVNANVGTQGRYGADATIDFRNNKLHYYFGADISKHGMQGNLKRYRESSSNDTTYFRNADGTFNFGRQRWSIRGGADYQFNDHNRLGFSLSMGDFTMHHNNFMNYEEWTDPTSSVSNYYTDNGTDRGGMYYSANLDFRHNFKENKEHYLEILSSMNSREGNEETDNYSFWSDTQIQREGKRTSETGPSNTFRIQADYVQPLAALHGKLEAGGQVRIRYSEDNNAVNDYDTTSGEYVYMDQYSNNTHYTRNIYAAYGMVSGEVGNLGYQAGLRGEYTYRYLEMIKTGETFVIDRPDFFPTLHLSYQLPAEQQTMVSYTRRIVRPRGFFLEPFISWSDANNVRQGNPGLEPEYVNSFDLGYQKKFGKGSQKHFVSFEAYYRITENKIERISDTWDENPEVTMQTFENVGTDYALGGELTLNYTPIRWYTFNLMGDFFDYKLDVDYEDLQYTQHNFSWNTRMNNTFKITSTTRFQVDLNYNSKRIRAQGTEKEFFTLNTALKQDFFKRKLSATLQVRDVFNTMNRNSITQSASLYEESEFYPNTPIIMLNLSWKLNNYREKRGGNMGGGDMDMGGEGGF